MTKQKWIQITSLGIYACSALAGLAVYTDMLPEKARSVATFAIGLTLAVKEGLTVANQYLVGPGAIQPPSVQAKLAALPTPTVPQLQDLHV